MIENTPSPIPNPLSGNSPEKLPVDLNSTPEKVKNCAAEAKITPSPEEAASKTVRSAMRTRAIINQVKKESIPKSGSQWKTQGELMYGPIVKGPHGPKTNIPLKTIEKVVTNLTEAKDIEGLRRLANILFTGPVNLRTYDKLRYDHPNVKELGILLAGNTSTNIPEKLKETFIKAAQEWRSGADQLSYTQTEKAAKFYQAGDPEEGDGIDINIDTFAQFNKIDPNTEIEITHGGGEWNILEFLKGEHEGYGLERGGVGLQVSPATNWTLDRSQEYSKTALLFFDNRAVLSAKIAAGKLKAAQNGGYEAGLITANIGHLKDVKVIVLSTNKVWEQVEGRLKERDFDPAKDLDALVKKKETPQVNKEA